MRPFVPAFQILIARGITHPLGKKFEFCQLQHFMNAKVKCARKSTSRVRRVAPYKCRSRGFEIVHVSIRIGDTQYTDGGKFSSRVVPRARPIRTSGDHATDNTPDHLPLRIHANLACRWTSVDWRKRAVTSSKVTTPSIEPRQGECL